MLLRDHPTAARRTWALALVTVLVVGGVLPARTVVASEPHAAAGARHLAEQHAGNPGDFTLVHVTSATIPDGSALWAGKYVDQRSGAVHLVYRDGFSGSAAGLALSSRWRRLPARSPTGSGRSTVNPGKRSWLADPAARRGAPSS